LGQTSRPTLDIIITPLKEPFARKNELSPIGKRMNRDDWPKLYAGPTEKRAVIPIRILVQRKGSTTIGPYKDSTVWNDRHTRDVTYPRSDKTNTVGRHIVSTDPSMSTRDKHGSIR
jgi:hypothetical protein